MGSSKSYMYCYILRNSLGGFNMLLASISAHIGLGAVVALFFVLYYINGEGKWKFLFEILIGVGGNAGIIFLLDEFMDVSDKTIKLYSIASCLLSFLVLSLIFLVIFSFIIKDKKDKDIIRLRDILLGQFSFINHYYEERKKETDGKLSLDSLEKREKSLTKKEEILADEKSKVEEDKRKIEELGKNKLKIKLPENSNIILNKEYVDIMPSYIGDIYNCISDINSCTDSLLSKPIDEINYSAIKSYLCSVATYISSDLFGGTSRDARIHFRIYDKEQNGYVKLVSVMGNKILTQQMTIIPYNDDSLIKRSYECKRALIKSINSSHSFKGENFRMWQDYMTYTFNGLLYDDKPYLTFGISIKNIERYKKSLHLINYFRLESFLQDNIDRINDEVNIASILYGGDSFA